MKNRGTITDPVCGMEVIPATAAGSARHQGNTYHFCGRSCLSKFEADPGRYARAGHPATQTKVPAGGLYTCPMHPEIRQEHAGDCPKCGMALEPLAPPPPASATEYTCPMHPQIVRAEPGDCPICGMALEPRTVAAAPEPNTELRAMTRRFAVSVVLAVPVFALGMLDAVLARSPLPPRVTQWIQFILATPVVLWGGWPFFVRGWRSLVHRSLNMFTLIAIGTGVAYVFSLAAVVAPGLFPSTFRGPAGEVPVYFGPPPSSPP